MQPSHFENATLQMLQNILNESPIKIEYEGNNQYSVFSKETNECIFRLIYDKNYDGDFRLEINGEKQNLHPEIIYTLRGDTIKAYRQQEQAKKEESKQAGKDRIEKQQQATMAFLKKFQHQ